MNYHHEFSFNEKALFAGIGQYIKDYCVGCGEAFTVHRDLYRYKTRGNWCLKCDKECERTAKANIKSAGRIPYDERLAEDGGYGII